MYLYEDNMFTQPTFKKGEQAYLIGQWDNKGTVFIESVTIESWGKKQGTYRRNTTNNMGRDAHDVRPRPLHVARMVPVTDDIEAVALALGNEFIAYERARLTPQAETHERIAKQLAALKATAEIIWK